MKALQNSLTECLNIDFPMVMAPMFLVSNEAMMKAGMDSGIAACFPTLNYREKGELEGVLQSLNDHREKTNSAGTYGVNLIVQRSNIYFEKHLAACVDAKVPFYFTSLGSPKEVIEAAHSYGGKVFCDVTNIKHAQKCYDLGCDGFVAVGQGAGGHAGPYPLQVLVPALLKEFPDKIVIGAGGLASGDGIASVLALGGQGVSIGTRFIATTEAGVSDAYKEAIVDSKMSDIVMTERLSGTPCTIIDTPYAKKIGYKQNWFEKMIQRNKTLKKYFKMLVQVKGMKKLESSVKPGSYKNLWCAGQSVHLIEEVEPIQSVVTSLENETWAALDRLEGLRQSVVTIS